MIGRLALGEERGLLVQIAPERLLGLPLLRGEPPGESFTARRVRRTARALRRRGVRRVLAPEGFPFWREVWSQGLEPVETGELCRALAAPIALAALEGLEIPPERASVALRGERLTRSLRAAALELCPRVRQLLVEVPAGGEELRRELRRTFGLPAVEPGAGRKAQLALCFSPPGGATGEGLDLSGPRPELAGFRFGLAEGALPPDVDALPLLAALWTAGRLSPGEMAVTCRPGPARQL